MKISIIGEGNVGSALRNGLEKAGHEVATTGDDKERVKTLARDGEVIILAVPYDALDEVAATIDGAAEGKTIVDVTNVLTPDMKLAVGHTTSGAEELQKKLPGAKVVKAFNTVFAHTMDSGKVDGEQLTAFVAGDDADAKARVADMARDIGFDAIDAGPLANARHLEPMGMLNIQLGYVLGLGTDIGIRLTH